MKTRALVLSCGGPGKGAYGAAVAATFCRKLGPNYFDAMYASSVGAHILPFMASNQPDVMENIWLNLCPGIRLINPLNVFRKTREVLDLEYLIGIYQVERGRLNLDAVFDSGIQLNFVLTDYETGKANYFIPGKENLFLAMMASSSVPFLHKPVKINNKYYTDGGLSDYCPVSKALEDGYSEVVAVLNYEINYKLSVSACILEKLAIKFLPGHLTQNWYRPEADEKILRDFRVKCIRPTSPLPVRSIFDVKRSNWIEAYNRGIEDCSKFIRNEA